MSRRDPASEGSQEEETHPFMMYPNGAVKLKTWQLSFHASKKTATSKRNSMFQSISNKPHRFFRKSRGRNRREKDSIFAFLRSRQLMKDNVLFLILNFCGEFADVQGKGIQQRLRQYIFFAAPEKAADSPILLQYAKFTFGLNGAVQAKLFAQICCDSS